MLTQKKKKKSHCRIKSQSQGHSGCYGFHSCHVPASMGMSCDPRDGSLPVSQPHTSPRVKIEALAMACISRFHSESVREALVLISGRWRWYVRLAEIPYFSRKNRGG